MTLTGSKNESSFFYFAYGSCMCPIDLQRTFGEEAHHFVIGKAILRNYRLGFYRHSLRRDCGALDVVPDNYSSVEGVLYRLPWRFSDRLDEREELPKNGYRHEFIEVYRGEKRYPNVRTYVVVNKLSEELAPNDWYFNVVLRGALSAGLSEKYCWKLFKHMYQLQCQQGRRQDKGYDGSRVPNSQQHLWDLVHRLTDHHGVLEQ